MQDEKMLSVDHCTLYLCGRKSSPSHQSVNLDKFRLLPRKTKHTSDTCSKPPRTGLFIVYSSSHPSHGGGDFTDCGRLERTEKNSRIDTHRFVTCAILAFPKHPHSVLGKCLHFCHRVRLTVIIDCAPCGREATTNDVTRKSVEVEETARAFERSGPRDRARGHPSQSTTPRTIDRFGGRRALRSRGRRPEPASRLVIDSVGRWVLEPNQIYAAAAALHIFRAEVTPTRAFALLRRDR